MMFRRCWGLPERSARDCGVGLGQGCTFLQGGVDEGLELRGFAQECGARPARRSRWSANPVVSTACGDPRQIIFPYALPLSLPSFGWAIQYSRSLFTGSPGQAGRWQRSV